MKFVPFAVLFALVGCAPPPLDGAFSTEPAVRVTWPLPETTVVGCTVVTVEVDNLELTDFSVVTEDADGQGHYHVTTPLGYTAIWTPYALISFETIDPQDGFLNIQLVGNSHMALTDDQGDFYEVDVPLRFEPGECTEFGATPTDTNYDTSSWGDSGT